jgi:hypothetical protein
VLWRANLLFVATLPAICGEVGHFNPGVIMVRDWTLPRDSGFYYLQYNAFYSASEYKDGSGNTAVAGQTDVFAYGMDHFFLWQTGKKFLGAKYGVLVRPTFGRGSVNAVINSQGRPPEVNTARQWGFGDLLVRPIFLGWHGEKWEAAAHYSFVAPTGRYRTGSAVNNGLGMWSHQFIGSGFYYPTKERKTTLMLTGVYEINTSQRGLDDLPGAHFGLEYGTSHFLNPRFEIGAAGFYFTQVSDNKGKDVVNPARRNRINGVGPQVWFGVVPGKFTVGARATWDYGVIGRFQGITASLSALYSF